MPVSEHTDTTEISTKNGCMRRYWKCLLLFQDRIWGSVHDVIFWQWKCQKSRQFCCWQCWDRFLLDFFVLGSRSIVIRLGVMSLTENWVLLISFLVKKHQLITIKTNHFVWLDSFYILEPENTLCKNRIRCPFYNKWRFLGLLSWPPSDNGVLKRGGSPRPDFTFLTSSSHMTLNLVLFFLGSTTSP